MPTRRMARGSRRSPRRRVIWARDANVFVLTGAAVPTVTNVDLLARLMTAGVGVIGGTVRFTHVQLEVLDGSAFVSNDVLLYATGLIPREDVGAALPTATAINPLRLNYAWSYWNQRSFITAAGGAAGTIGDFDPNRIEFTTKGARRLPEFDQAYALSLTYNSVNPAKNLSVNVTTKCLVALP